MYLIGKKTAQRTKNALYVLLLFLTAMHINPAQAQSVDLNCSVPMVFGEIIPCGAAGSVVIRPDGSGAVATCVVMGSAPTSEGRCQITQGFAGGFRPMQIDITTPSISITSGGNSMTVNNFNIITNSGGDSYVAPAGPFVDVPIGATLNVGATQASGTYNGTFNVMVTLQ